MGIPRTFSHCFLGSSLCSTGSQALQCYSYEHTYFGPFDLSAVKLPSVSCPEGCSEVVLSSDTGYRSSVTMVRKGCWTGPTTGPMQTNQDASPPDYAVVRGCATDYCNSNLKTHDALPNSSQAPNPQTLSGTECYACLGTHPEDCSPEKSRRVQCHQDQSACFQGNGRMNIGNFSVPVYIRTCHRPSCTTMGTTSPWTSIDSQGYCCEGHLCNRASVTQISPGTMSSAPPRAPRISTSSTAAPLSAIALGASVGFPA